MSEVLTTSEAVRTFRMHPATVLRLILTGRVSAQKNADGRWLIDRDGLERWDRSRGQRSAAAALGVAHDTKGISTEA